MPRLSRYRWPCGRLGQSVGLIAFFIDYCFPLYCSFAGEPRRCGTSVRVVRLSLPAINRKSQLARIRLRAFRTSVVRTIKPREQQLACPKVHHAIRFDYQRFTGTRDTPLPFALFFNGEDPDSAQFHALAALQRTGNLIQYHDNQTFGLGASSFSHGCCRYPMRLSV